MDENLNYEQTKEYDVLLPIINALIMMTVIVIILNFAKKYSQSKTDKKPGQDRGGIDPYRYPR
jgi:hypothetical protein